jgi:hypothetical protein
MKSAIEIDAIGLNKITTDAHAEGYRAGIEAAALTVAASWAELDPARRESDLIDRIQALSQPREPTPSPAATCTCGMPDGASQGHAPTCALPPAAPRCETCADTRWIGYGPMVDPCPACVAKEGK